MHPRIEVAVTASTRLETLATDDVVERGMVSQESNGYQRIGLSILLEA